MGEAKRKEAALRVALLKEADLWDRPASDWEAGQVAAIRQLPIVQVTRAPQDQLDWGGMRKRECHSNCIFYAENDPTGITKHILGWWIQGDLLVLHSVVANEGRHICLTPQERDVPEQFAFIPDASITSEVRGDTIHYMRSGQAIEGGLRLDPDAHRASIRLMRERLLAGMKPWRAMHLADDEAAERLGLARQYS